MNKIFLCIFGLLNILPLSIKGMEPEPDKEVIAALRGAYPDIVVQVSNKTPNDYIISTEFKRPQLLKSGHSTRFNLSSEWQPADILPEANEQAVSLYIKGIDDTVRLTNKFNYFPKIRALVIQLLGDSLPGGRVSMVQDFNRGIVNFLINLNLQGANLEHTSIDTTVSQ